MAEVKQGRAIKPLGWGEGADPANRQGDYQTYSDLCPPCLKLWRQTEDDARAASQQSKDTVIDRFWRPTLTG